MSALALLFGVLSLVVFLTSLAVHVAAFVPGSGVSVHRTVAVLHLGAMGALIAAAIHYSAARKRLGCGEPAYETATNQLVPRWVRSGFLVLFAYMMLNFGYFAVTYEGQPRVREGKFALTSHGRLIRELSEEEFRAAERFEVRGVSGHWMLFSALPAFYFLYLYPRARALPAADPDDADGAGDPR